MKAGIRQPLGSDHYVKPAALNMKPEKLRQLAYERTVDRLERQF